MIERLQIYTHRTNLEWHHERHPTSHHPTTTTTSTTTTTTTTTESPRPSEFQHSLLWCSERIEWLRGPMEKYILATIVTHRHDINDIIDDDEGIVIEREDLIGEKSEEDEYDILVSAIDHYSLTIGLYSFLQSMFIERIFLLLNQVHPVLE